MNIKLNNKMQILVLFILASSLVCIAQSIITTGLVYLMSDFSVSSTQAQWSYSAFLLVVGVMIPLSAFISRRFSAKAIFFFSLIIFLLGSIICYFSNSLIVLIIGRVLQAIGNGIIMPYVQILLLRTIPEEKWQTYMGLYGLVNSNSSRNRFFFRRIRYSIIWLEGIVLIFHNSYNNSFSFRYTICKRLYSY